MQIGERLRELREAKNFSQGDIEKRTGLLRCYVSRVENSHTVPAVETLAPCARSPVVQTFLRGDRTAEEIASCRARGATVGNKCQGMARAKQTCQGALPDGSEQANASPRVGSADGKPQSDNAMNPYL
jgi:transcriptional regulator with XRE-family HTH domain